MIIYFTFHAAYCVQSLFSRIESLPFEMLYHKDIFGCIFDKFVGIALLKN